MGTPLNPSHPQKPLKGSFHWIMQRLSAVLLAPVALWFVWGALPHLLTDPVVARHWLSSAFNAGGCLLWTVLMFWHGALGVQVVLEDYIPSPRYRHFAIVLMKLLAFLGAVVAGAEIVLLRGGGL